MARPRAFDEATALDAALECFWRHGWEAASVRDLAAEMGINGPSLYNTFGCKRALFTRVLEQYATRFMRENIRVLQAQAPKAAIQTFFRDTIARALSDTERRGCLIINSALEVAPHDRELRAVISAYLAELEAFFRDSLERGKAGNTIPASLDSQDMGRLYLGLLIGIRVMARSRPERAFLEGMARPALALLDRPGPYPSPP